MKGKSEVSYQPNINVLILRRTGCSLFENFETEHLFPSLARCKAVLYARKRYFTVPVCSYFKVNSYLRGGCLV